MSAKIISTIAAILVLSACGLLIPRVDINDTQSVASAISIQRDDFKKLTKYDGPDVMVDDADGVFIRAWKEDATKIVEYQIYVRIFYVDNWRLYKTAYDSDGNRLDVTVIARNIESCGGHGCSREEHLGINIPREYLEKKQETGIRFQVSGKGGDEVFFIPGAYIKAFLSIVN
jgi:hypothetical protein